MTANDEAMKTALRVTKALADRQRVRVLMLLHGGELCVCQIVEVLRLAPSTVSRHLSILDGSGLVAARKQGRWMYYRLPKGGAAALIRPALKWLRAALKDDSTIEQDAKKLKAVVACDAETICRRQRRRGQTC